ncbi:MAG: hypothetical protein HYS23_11175 [Geobacter sp.]|nr:hypothetical protein [Geobacter sp.]
MAKLSTSKTGMLLVRLSSTLRKCKEAVKSSAGFKVVDVREIESTPTKAVHYIIDTVTFSSTIDKDEEREIPVSLFMASPASPFWLCVAIQVEHIERKDFLTHVSIKVYNGLAASTEKNLCFRAEWDPRDGNHGQPHWHLDLALSQPTMQLPQPTFEEIIAQETRTSGFEGFLERGKDIIERPAKPKTLSLFHFAMCTNWHDGKKDYNHSLTDEEALINWVRNVLKYIKDQLGYVNSGYQKVA